MNNKLNVLLSASTLLAAAAVSHAHSGFDISPQRVGNELTTNGVSHSTNTHPLTGETTAEFHRYVYTGLRVFGIEFGGNPTFPRRASDPGINNETGTYRDAETGETVNLTGTNLPQGSLLSFTAISPLQYWTGSGFVPAPNGSAIAVSDGFETLTITPSSGEQTLPLVNIPANTNVHLHLSSNLSPAAPEGIYLFSARLDTDAANITDSAPIYLAYNFGGAAYEDAHEAAIDYIQATFIPEPATASVAALAATATLLRRRRARSTATAG